MQYISIAHNWFKYVVVAAGLVAVIKQAFNLISRQSYQDRDKLLLTILIHTLEIEAGLGSILIIKQILFKQSTTPNLIHGLIGLVPLGLVYLIENRELNWSKKEKPLRLLLSITALIILTGGVSYFAPSQPVASELYVLRGHDEAVRSVEFSPDQRTLASGSFDGTIRIWDLNSGEELQVIPANDEPIRDISYSDDGEFLSSVSSNHQLSIWKTPEGNFVLDFPAHEASINCVIWKGDVLYSASLDNTIRVWDPKTGDMLRQIDHNHTGGILSLALSPDGQLLASGGIDGTIWLHNTLDDSDSYLGAHTSWVYDLAFSCDGKLLASSSLDGTVSVWDLTTQSLLFHSETLGEAIQAVAISPDSSILLGGSADSSIYVWDLDSYKQIDTLSGHQRGILDLDFTADGKYFASGSADNTVIIWKMAQP